MLHPIFAPIYRASFCTGVYGRKIQKIKMDLEYQIGFLELPLKINHHRGRK
jgi:hypothetical protein